MLKKIILLFATVILIFSSNIVLAKESDYEIVNNLVISERMYRVSHRYNEHANCFFADATIRTSWQTGDVSSFVGKHPEENFDEIFNVNRCGSALIHLRKKRALVEYPTTTIRTVKINGKNAVLTSYMRILYRIEKRAGKWKISEMTSINEADELSPMIPGTDLKIDPRDVENLRSSYRWLAYARKNAGGNISDDLLGIDRPEDIQRIYDESFLWLES